jgi:hypothetical protein
MVDQSSVEKTEKQKIEELEEKIKELQFELEALENKEYDV